MNSHQDAPEEDTREEGPNVYLVTLWEGVGYEGSGVYGFGATQHLEATLTAVVDTPRESNVIDVWLQSGGGSAHEAYRYMLLLREYAPTVRVVVGRYAKSAATLMILGADTIYMGPGSDLGPLDAQIFIDEDDKYISALDVARSVEHLASTALDLALSGGAAVHHITGIPRKDVLPAILAFSSDFVRPVVAKLDPSAIHRASSQLDVAREYGKRLLGMRAEPFPEEEAEALTYHLVNDYPDHGFIISRQEAEDLGLPVVPLTEYEAAGIFGAMIDRLDDQGLSVQVFKRHDLVADDDGEEGPEVEPDSASDVTEVAAESADRVSSPRDREREADVVTMREPREGPDHEDRGDAEGGAGQAAS